MRMGRTRIVCAIDNFRLLGLLIACFGSLSVFGQTSPLPKDIDTMIGDCMLDSMTAIRSSMNLRKVLEDALGKHKADELTERSIADHRKAAVVCANRTAFEKAEIEQKYAQEFGYKRQPPTGGASSAFEPGGILNPITIQVLPAR